MNHFFSEIDFTNVRGFLLDLDHTLYDYHPCHAFALKKCFESFFINEIKKNLSFLEFESQYEKAKISVKHRLSHQAAGHSRFLYFQTMFENLFGRTDVLQTIQFEKSYWEHFFSKMVLQEGVMEFLQKCRDKHIKICLVTDLTAALQFQKVLYLKLEPFIDFIVSSEEAGVEKPHGEIFRLALQKLKLSASEVVMIGDDEKKDIAGAQEIGVHGILFQQR